MPTNTPRTLSPFIPGSGNPDTAYEVVSTVPGSYSPYAAGELGTSFPWGNRVYMKVLVEAAANPVAAGQLAFWKDRVNNIVTNVAANALLNGVAASNRNNVAGVFRGAPPAGSQCFILTHGVGIPVLEAGAGAGGMTLVANTGTNADALGVAIGTAPVAIPIGVVVTNFAGGKVTANIDIEV